MSADFRSRIEDTQKIIADRRNAQPALGLTVTMRVRIISKVKLVPNRNKEQIYLKTCTYFSFTYTVSP